MNKLTKIGLTALAGSLVAVSAHAGSMSVSGSASLTISDADVDNTQATTAEGNLKVTLSSSSLCIIYISVRDCK